ncbi:MAG: hypothetical protein II956_09630 [Bacteroidales bacterium]|nr:hypothetical protein [Bacteroidales bacterium]
MEETLKNTPADISQTLFAKIADIIESSRKKVVSVVNTAMAYTYYEVGRIIVEVEQKGELRAEYGQKVLKNIAKKLTAQFGKGFSYTNLEQMRKFYKVYSKIPQTLSEKFSFTLSWSHYLFLMRIDNPDERSFYEIEARNSNWSIRELKRQFDSRCPCGNNTIRRQYSDFCKQVPNCIAAKRRTQSITNL